MQLEIDKFESAREKLKHYQNRDQNFLFQRPKLTKFANINVAYVSLRCGLRGPPPPSLSLPAITLHWTN